MPSVTASALDGTIEAAPSKSEGASSDRFERAWEGYSLASPIVLWTLRGPRQAVCSSTQRRRASRGTRTARPTRITGRDPSARARRSGSDPAAAPPPRRERSTASGCGRGELAAVHPLSDRLEKRRRDTYRALACLARTGMAPWRCLRRGRIRAARWNRLIWGWHQQVLGEPVFGEMSLAGMP